ncbi:acetyl-CoA carboxylase biotin carboxylase subunit [sulfur-oxidizing endosymbiont of Gigantopelta aegis]|uniref:acetyl-CoA carboxylase biotin carboxylase subunit n=1 Tax=sulfur-oxidizing endosymbiont of Gigantopelta aegis TaxID=2794934 RepID=UPI0018DDAC6F|nr:acetyl-CoA carboxylase biotin carboxylase subunit [sulfur-oxidizing endosymbiont of Gigantopelta aegis]
MITKILIANRGEIAVRIIRACAEMNITSVAVYADTDRHALHVKKADEAYCLGPDPVAGYLNAHRLVNIALASGCDAIHPGYGFLSENPLFAKICERRNIKFIGPRSEVIENLGNKTHARATMIAAGVPVTPGSEGNLANITEALSVAKTIGYPVMLKATSGGGGRGIRLCNNKTELKNNYPRVISEATKAFGSADVFMEKCVVNPKHIEVQILADEHGNVIHLFERDCSIQRRHQKLIEIAPSPQLSQAQRLAIGDLAVKAAKATGYSNAGTVEFLMAEDDQFYFMEVNTRLQVEHTISEQITGIDIVQEQFRIASGLKLRFKQADIQIRGYAMEFRINAEDPKNDFLPSYGRITRYLAPGGPGVRTDAAIYTGYVIPPYYDSMCAKLIVWALEWDEVIQRSKRALKDMGVYGVKTTIPYQYAILSNEEFINGSFNTSFVEQHPELVNYSVKCSKQHVALAFAAAIAAHQGM